MDIVSFFREERDKLFERWKSAARSQIAAASDASTLALENELPLLFEDIQEALLLIPEEESGRAAGTKAFTRSVSAGHGRQRAATAGYTVEQVQHEYVLLRHVLTDAIHEANLWDYESAEAVVRVLECASLEAVSKFIESLDEARNKLLGTLAHDIRSPLSVTKTALSVINNLASNVSEQELEEIRSMAEAGVDQSLERLASLLDTVVAEAGDGLLMTFEKGDFGEIVSAVCNASRAIYGHDRVKGSDFPMIPGCFDKDALRRILDNLMSNAVRYGLPGGAVTISLVDADGFVYLEVQNFGDEISKEKLETMFNFLEGTAGIGDKSIRSWGIGLSFVKLACEAHGGSVTAKSNSESGTTFTVKLAKSAHSEGKVRTRIGLETKAATATT